MKKRVAYIISIYVATVMIFIVGKLCFMAYHHTDHPLTASDVSDVLWHGLSLDLSTSIYIILLPFLLTVVSLWCGRWSLSRRILKVYHAIIAAALSLALVCDTSLYEFWGFKLNSTALSYIESPQGMTASVSAWYIIIRVVAICAIAFIFYKLYTAITPKSFVKPRLFARIAATACSLVVAFFLVIGIRGGFSESTTNIGQVYFSQTQYLNHAAVNPLFSFLSSFEHGENDYNIYEYYDEQTCHELTDGFYNTESVGSDTLLSTRRPNVVIILLESCGGMFTEIGGRDDIMPNLNRLSREGIYFSKCFANSWRTDRGTVCTLSGYPSFPMASVMKMPDKSRTMPSIAAGLRREGYSTEYLYGGDINFTNMRGYLVATGFEKLTSMDDYPKKERESAKWGVRDDLTFNTLYDMITAHKQDERFLIGYSTLSSHEPWDVPVSKFDDKVFNAFYYLDKCIGDFIARLKETPQWNNLLIIMLPDHGITYAGVDNTQLLHHHIPMIWTGGAVRQPKEIDRICNQTDLAATLLGQMGIGHGEFAFSRDVLSSTYKYPSAMNTFSNGIMMVDSTGYIVYDLDFKRFTADRSSNSERLLKMGKAILQVTSNDLKNR